MKATIQVGGDPPEITQNPEGHHLWEEEKEEEEEESLFPAEKLIPLGCGSNLIFPNTHPRS